MMSDTDDDEAENRWLRWRGKPMIMMRRNWEKRETRWNEWDRKEKMKKKKS